MKRIRLILTVCALTAMLMCFLLSCASVNPAQSVPVASCGAQGATPATGPARASGPSTQKANQKTKHRMAHNYYQTHQAITQK